MKIPEGRRLLPLVIPGFLLEIVVGCTLIAVPSLCLSNIDLDPAVARKVLNCPSKLIFSNLLLNFNKLSYILYIF